MKAPRSYLPLAPNLLRPPLSSGSVMHLPGGDNTPDTMDLTVNYIRVCTVPPAIGSATEGRSPSSSIFAVWGNSSENPFK